MKRFFAKLLRFVARAAGAVAALIVLGALYALYATHRDREAFPAPGILVMVNQHRLHLFCTGQGSPTVVFESAAFGPSILWGQIQPKIASSTRVCSYDRDGIGWSEESGLPRTADRYATNLQDLLANAGETGPFVIVGHSLGAILAMNFARRYPNEVAGMVLLDPSHPDQFAEGSEQWRDHQQALPLFHSAPYLAALGWLRGALWLTDKLKPLPLPPLARAENIAIASTLKAARAMKAEADALLSLCAKSKTLPDLGDKPLIVLSAERTLAEGFPVALHEALARCSTRGVHRIVADASHSGIVLKPASAETSAAAILEVVNATKE